MANGMKAEVFFKVAEYSFSYFSCFSDWWNVDMMVGAGAATLDDEVKDT